MNKKYIEMCRKAKELQTVWEPKVGDRVYDIIFNGGPYFTGPKPFQVRNLTYCYPTTSESKSGFKHQFIWLPYQEQLQDLLEKEEHFFSKVELGWKDGDCEGWDVFWLSSYMEEIHHKFWDGDEWVEKGEW